jgi:cytidyltransferase-like protein
MQPIALYVGSFDPVTNGHMDVVRHAAKLASRLVIAIGVHPGKVPLFSADERLAMLTETCADMVRGHGCAFDCMTFADLAVATGAAGRGHLDDSRVARRHRSRLRNAAGRDERGDGARCKRCFCPLHPWSVPSPPPWSADCRHGRRHFGFVPATVASRLKKKFAAKAHI